MVRPIDLVMTVIEKYSLLYSQIPRRRDMPGNTQESWGCRFGQEAEGKGQLWAGAFIMVFSGRRQDKSGFRIGQFELF